MSQRIPMFDTWQAGYANASVVFYVANTTTKADVYYDDALTDPAPNPVTLQSMWSGGVGYGKFAQPLYTAQSIYLVINSTDETGIISPPLTTLDDEDASDALVTVLGGTVARTIKSILADEIYAENYGAISPSESAATNTTTITSAISAAAALGGARVMLPEGSLQFTSLTLSAGVVLCGRERGTTILQSQTAAACITIAGDAAGLRNMDLDGINLQAGSIGLYALAKDEILLENVTIKRFETGVKMQGGRRVSWSDVYVDDCDTGVAWRGDENASGAGGGDELRHNYWQGGLVSNCTVAGVHLEYVDMKCIHNTIEDVGFESNTGSAVKVNGARFTKLPGCWWLGNTVDLEVLDGTDPTKADENTVVGLQVGPGGEFDGGEIIFGGKCQAIVFDQVQFRNDCALSFALVDNNILARDCLEDSTVTLSGTDAIRWERQRSSESQYGGTAGVTSDATATTGFKYTPEPGEVGIIEAKVVGVRRDGTDYAVYHIGRGFRRPGSTLAYQGQTSNFIVGDVITGGTSGAQARVIADSDSGATGTLTLKDITKEFLNGETITSSSGGQAVANGTLTHSGAALLGSTTSLQAAVETVGGWAADFAVSGNDVLVQVTGAGSQTVEWSVHAQVTSG